MRNLIAENPELGEELAADLKDYLAKRFYYKNPRVQLMINSIAVYANRIQYDLMLRLRTFGKWPENCLVIGRTEFRDRGNGMDWMRFVLSLAERYRYDEIGLECVADGARPFAERLGFSLIPAKVPTTPGWPAPKPNNYIIDLPTLREHLSVGEPIDLEVAEEST